jgi:hypothetical protein
MLVRPRAGTTVANPHGGAHMDFADTLGAVGTFPEPPHRHAHDDHRLPSTKFIGAPASTRT